MDWLDSLEQDGFAVVPGLLAPGEVERLSTAFDGLLERARSGIGDGGGAEFVVDRDPFRLHRVVWAGGTSPAIAALGGDPRFLGIAARVLGSDTVVQLIQQAHFKLPGDGVDFDWHQDASNRRYGTDLWSDVNGRGSFVQIAVAVDPMGPDNGGLQMQPGSHRKGFVAELGTGVVPPEHLDPSRVVAVELEPGDAVVFGPFVLHGSGPNPGPGARRLFLQGYASPGANRRVYPGCGTGVVRRIAR